MSSSVERLVKNIAINGNQRPVLPNRRDYEGWKFFAGKNTITKTVDVFAAAPVGASWEIHRWSGKKGVWQLHNTVSQAPGLYLDGGYDKVRDVRQIDPVQPKAVAATAPFLTGAASKAAGCDVGTSFFAGSATARGMRMPLRSFKLTKFDDSDWSINHIGAFAILRPPRARSGSPPSEEFRACLFYSCREQFQRVFTSQSHNILFVHGEHSGENVFAFIQVIEEKLNLNKKTTAGPTQRKIISWFEVSPFWMSEPMRKSLFTALLRGGLNYHPHAASAFSRAVESQTYLRETKFALERFLSGYTHFTGRAGGVRGWYETFGLRDRRFYEGGRFIWRRCNPSPEAIKKMLVKPEKEAM